MKGRKDRKERDECMLINSFRSRLDEYKRLVALMTAAHVQANSSILRQGSTRYTYSRLVPFPFPLPAKTLTVHGFS